MRGYLEQAGFTVLGAYSGNAALQTLRSERPDLLILDLMLPDQDGWGITREQESAVKNWIAEGAPWPEGRAGKIRRKPVIIEHDDYR